MNLCFAQSLRDRAQAGPYARRRPTRPASSPRRGPGPYRFVLLAWLCLLAPVLAPADTFTVSEGAHKQLTAVRERLNAGQWVEAETLLDQCITAFSREPYALAVAWQMRGYLYGETERPAQALAAFEQALTLDALDPALQQQIHYNSAQLLLVLQRPAEAVRRIETWMAAIADPTPDQRVRVAWIYFGAERYKTAAGHLESAIAAAATPETSWYELMVATLHHAGDYNGTVRWLPRLIERNPRESRYWLQLAGAYLQLGKERQAAAVLSAAYHNQLFQEPVEIVRLARFYCQAGVPHNGAGVLEQALDAARLPANADHQQLLADAWLQARETRRAVRVLTHKARNGGGCQIRLRLGRLLMQLGEWGEAREHLDYVIRAGCEGRQGAEPLLLLGMAAYQEGRLETARAAFLEARNRPSLRKQAESWLTMIEQALSRRCNVPGKCG
ncbi:tetratricopeptide repeat protein [Desulfatitalea alkaliphila]|uniref:Tetratricopeptide repeat protein n=1 Tax=Desulfatitalea alkaliphila TaxID=2929485 RepID=A0AA41R5Y8_9BACT|nr:tetratricopeptide repeat protein [Desulfatitalea alkaliphila]MCJ8499778.1 tetratricopeptide repeat protein [Desulfatitalea alkaliphila]